MSSLEKDTNKTKDMLGRAALIHVDRALGLLLENLADSTLSTERLPIEAALDRITALDVYSPENLPAYPRSTMDGFAVLASDTFGASESMPCYLNIAGEILMGEDPSQQLSKGSCFRIATGGLLPPGSDAIVMFEHTVPVDDTMIEIVKSVGSGTNVINTGDDIGLNQLALPAGHLLRPQDLGLLAGIGVSEIEVYRHVRMGILSTGDEIIPYSETVTPGKIRNINSIAISSQAKRLGVKVIDYGIVSDREDSFFPAIKRAVAENDLVVFSGGSSVGTRDLGEKAINTLGAPGVLVHGVALKPGKPILIGLHGRKPIFGLPGHPVSAMVCFDYFVQAAIRKLSGLVEQSSLPSPVVRAVLARNIHSAPGRRDVVRVQLTQINGKLNALPVLGKSGSISTLSRAHGFFIIEEPLQGLTEETEVEVHLYQ